MLTAGNFHPEWGYLAPAPSFVRTVRAVLVAAAVGAVGGAGVVLSLIDRPADVDVATRTLAAPAASDTQAHATVQSPQTQSPQATPGMAETPPANDGAAARAVTEAPALPADTSAAAGPAPAPKKAAAKKRRSAPLYASRGGFAGDSYEATGGLYMNGAGSYHVDRWGYQD